MDTTETSFFEEPSRLVEVAPEIYSCPFLTEGFCEFLIALAANNKEGWTRNAHDRTYSTSDFMLHARSPEIFMPIEQELDRVIWPLLQKIWEFNPVCVSQAFIVNYSLGAQISLKQHIDDSYITAGIKLNSEYHGADIVFPRQKFTTKDVPVGHILLWPSQITHPHYVSELTQGEKYSLVIWTDEK